MIDTKKYKISPSNSHEDCWIFSVKGANTFFMITASEDYIKGTYGEE